LSWIKMDGKDKPPKDNKLSNYLSREREVQRKA
jgi:hypothetical protein